MVTYELLKEYLHYEPSTGLFTLIKNSGYKHIGESVGYIELDGYVSLSIKGKRIKAHRAAWLYMFGSINKKCIDHINGIKNDNRLCNLREATSSENKMNSKKPVTNSSGFKGVTWHKYHKKWMAATEINYKVKFIGYFETAALAGKAYIDYVKPLHGEFYHEQL